MYETYVIGEDNRNNYYVLMCFRKLNVQKKVEISMEISFVRRYFYKDKLYLSWTDKANGKLDK